MKLAFVGYGSIAEAHARALQQLDDVQLVTVVGRRPEPTQQFAEAFGFRRVVFDLADALADQEIEAVVITSPSDQHAAQTEACLRAGKHVLCEIPLAMNYADAARVARLAEESGQTLMVAHTQRFEPALIELRRRVLAGELNVHHIVVRWYFFRRENLNWLGKRRSWTDNLLWHHGCHVVDAVTWMLDCDRVRGLQAQVAPPHPELGIPLDHSILFRSGRNQLVTIAMSYNSPVPLHDYAFIAEQDTLTLDLAEGTIRGKEGVVFAQPRDTAIPDQDREFLSAIREGRAAAVSGTEVLPTMAMLQRVQEIFDRQ